MLGLHILAWLSGRPPVRLALRRVYLVIAVAVLSQIPGCR
jgi:hypothetical protein